MAEFFRTRAALVRVTVASLILIGVLFAFVFPTRTWLQQRNATADAQQQLDVLRDQTKKLVTDAARLRSDQEVERVARERFGLVMPGEQAWAIVPAPTTTTTTTTTLPPAQAAAPSTAPPTTPSTPPSTTPPATRAPPG